MLNELNIEPERVKLEWFSTGESSKLLNMINQFVEELEKLGPIKAYVKT